MVRFERITVAHAVDLLHNTDRLLSAVHDTIHGEFVYIDEPEADATQKSTHHEPKLYVIPEEPSNKRPKVVFSDRPAVGAATESGENFAGAGKFFGRAGRITDKDALATGRIAGTCDVVGSTDVEIAEMTKWFLEHTVDDQGFRREVEPKIVLEVAFNNMMQSDRHESGYALRFPRIVRLRPDKTPEDADRIERVREIFEKQGSPSPRP